MAVEVLRAAHSSEAVVARRNLLDFGTGRVGDGLDIVVECDLGAASRKLPSEVVGIEEVVEGLVASEKIGKILLRSALDLGHDQPCCTGFDPIADAGQYVVSDVGGAAGGGGAGGGRAREPPGRRADARGGPPGGWC